MFLVRRSKPDDVSTLVKLAKMVYFVNLPPNEPIIQAKIEQSTRCFRKAAGVPVEAAHGRRRRSHRSGAGWADAGDDSELFMLTIEDTHTRGVIGTSQVRAHQGGPGNPNWTFKISEKAFRSERLGWGSTHKVGQLYGDESGPTEIGGLIIQPSYRGHPARPGRLLSFARFHWMALHRAAFADRVLAEMMGPVSEEGDNVFWDHFGRKFIPVRFGEADRFCQHNRGFISDLLPKEEIYLSLFPLEVQNQIGVVGRDTLPALRLLESLGFRNRGFVDPFDGGPHLDAPTDDIPLVRETRRLTAGKAADAPRRTARGIVSSLDKDGEFRCTEDWVELTDDGVRLSAEAMDLLRVKAGAEIGVTPLKGIVPDELPHEGAGAQTPVRPARAKATRAKASTARAGRTARPGARTRA
ncbi:MAG: arginine N-succinyltransferase [Planctomycetota bacterium]|nr:arginine N-succinyltransferase [Planctomycetota bacterium]